MARPTTFTREMIVEVATALVAEHGMAGLTARNVAEKLRSSTAPIYASFGNIEGLKEAVLERARSLLRETTRRPWSDRPFLNEGTGLVVFARENPQLYALLFLTPETARVALPRVYADLLADMKKDPRFQAFSAHERNQVLEKMWFLAVGMATLVHAGQLPDCTTHGIMTSLLEAGNVIIPDALKRVTAARGK